jgi:hypothetical protein
MVWAALAIGIWSQLLKAEQPVRGRASCPVVSTAAAPETLVSHGELESVMPVAPRGVEVGVSNATDRRGLATQVTSSLRGYGFALATTRGNDLLHPLGSMRCSGQIRFGPNGAAAARTLALVMPCADLIRDQRTDSRVDLIVGAAFSALDPNPAARTVLTQLDGNTQQAGGVQSVAGPAVPDISQSLLAAAHQDYC